MLLKAVSKISLSQPFLVICLANYKAIFTLIKKDTFYYFTASDNKNFSLPRQQHKDKCHE
jgi:hypothetical protein